MRKMLRRIHLRISLLISMVESLLIPHNNKQKKWNYRAILRASRKE